MLHNLLTYGKSMFHPTKRVMMWEDVSYKSKTLDKDGTRQFASRLCFVGRDNLGGL